MGKSPAENVEAQKASGAEAVDVCERRFHAEYSISISTQRPIRPIRLIGNHCLEATTPEGLSASRTGISHRGPRVHRDILPCSIDEPAPSSPVLLSNGMEPLRLSVLCDLCGRKFLKGGYPKRSMAKQARTGGERSRIFSFLIANRLMYEVIDTETVLFLENLHRE